MLNVKNVFRAAGFMMLATLLAKALGLYRDVLIAAYYGTGEIAQAFSVASRIPLLFFDIALGAAITSAFIPVFNEYMERNELEEAIRYSNIFVNVIFLITLVVCVIGMMFSQQVVGLISSGSSEEVKLLASRLVIILFPTMIFTALAYALAGVLQSFGEFNVPAAISLVSNGIMVVFLLVAGDKLGIEGVAVAMLIGWAFQVLIQIPSLIKKKYRYRPIVNLRHPGLMKSARLALPILISSWVQPINSMVNINLASSLNGGQAVPALDYANKVYVIFVGVLTYAISNLIFPTLSRYAASKNEEEFRSLISRALGAVLAIIVPVMVLFLVLHVPIIRFMYERREFGAESTALTAQALLFYSMGMAGFATCEIVNKAFYSMSDGKTPMYVAMAGISCNILMSFLFVRGLGLSLEGLALAASIAAVGMGIALVVLLHRRIGFVTKGMLLNVGKLALCAVGMGVVVWMVSRVYPGGASMLSRFMALLIPGAAGGVVYIALGLLLRVEEGMVVLNLLKKRFVGEK